MKTKTKAWKNIKHMTQILVKIIANTRALGPREKKIKSCKNCDKGVHTDA